MAYNYRAYKNKTLVFSPLYIHGTECFDTFKYIEVPNSRVIGVVQKSRPTALLVMHDFETDQVWVCGHDNRAAEIRLLEKIQACYPEKNYHSADMSIVRVPEMNPREAVKAVERQWQVSFPDTIKDVKAAFFSKEDYPWPKYIIKLTLDKDDYIPFLNIFGQDIHTTDWITQSFYDCRGRGRTPDWFIEPIETGEYIRIQANEQCQNIHEQYWQDMYGRATDERHVFTFYSDTSKDNEVTLYLDFKATDPELF